MVAIPIAILAGLVSFLSPCCLPLLPGYLAYVSGSAGADAEQSSSATTAESGTRVRAAAPTAGVLRSRTVIGTLLFVLGFAAVFTSYGAVFGALGASLIENQLTITRVLGGFTILLGLMFAGVLADPNQSERQRFISVISPFWALMIARASARTCGRFPRASSTRAMATASW